MEIRGGEARPTASRPALLLAAAMVTLVLLAWPALAGALVLSGGRPQGALRFWTAARMKAARPLDLRLPGRGETSLSAPASASSAFETVPDPTRAVSRVNGAIFIETPFGLGRCSGTSVNAPNYSVVFTAAHCINTGGPDGRWMDPRWVFVPGYRYGQRPFGVFPA